MLFRSIVRPLAILVLVSVFWLTEGVVPGFSTSAVLAQGTNSDPKAMAIYADAANFQTNGAIDLAIERWEAFLQAYGNHELA